MQTVIEQQEIGLFELLGTMQEAVTSFRHGDADGALDFDLVISELNERDFKTPVQPAPHLAKTAIKDVLSSEVDSERPARLSLTTYFRAGALLLQFADCNSHFSNTPLIEFQQLEEYKDALASSGSGPADYAKQLSVALELSKGSLDDSLWLLALASRQYARWRDTSIVADLPDWSQDRTVQEMVSFYKFIAATEEKEANIMYRDTAGDAYLAWTHALGHRLTGRVRAPRLIKTHFVKLVDEGTNVMNRHFRPKPRPDGLRPSFHLVAADYGNMIGRLTVEV